MKPSTQILLLVSTVSLHKGDRTSFKLQGGLSGKLLDTSTLRHRTANRETHDSQNCGPGIARNSAKKMISSCVLGFFARGVFQKMPALEGQFLKNISVRFAGENHLRTPKNTKQSSAQRFLNDPFPKTPFSSCWNESNRIKVEPRKSIQNRHPNRVLSMLKATVESRDSNRTIQNRSILGLEARKGITKNLSSQVLGEVRWAFWGEFLLKLCILWIEGPHCSEYSRGRLWMILCYWKTCSVPKIIQNRRFSATKHLREVILDLLDDLARLHQAHSDFFGRPARQGLQWGALCHQQPEQGRCHHVANAREGCMLANTKGKSQMLLLVKPRWLCIIADHGSSDKMPWLVPSLRLKWPYTEWELARPFSIFFPIFPGALCWAIS